jgi:predicted PurR-regulated permease PerM
VQAGRKQSNEAKLSDARQTEESEVEPNRSPDLARTTLQLLALGALIGASLWIMRPFLVALVWATTVAIATWPLLLGAESWFGGRRGLAVALMTVVLLLILVVPLYFAITTITGNVAQVTEWSKSLAALIQSRPPTWVSTLPLVGTRIATSWRQLTAAGPTELSAYLAPFARTITLWFLGRVGSLGMLLVQFLLTTMIAAILYANGETAARGILTFARGLAGPQGEKAMYLAAQAVRGVALGVVVTAILQSILAGIGLAVVGVPFAALLTAVMFILSVAQIGPAPVLIAAVIWVYSRSGVMWGTGLLVWAIFCVTFDNVVRPLLIKRGADLPLLLIFAGVIGGLIAFGVIGLFIGPVVLAVAYTLLIDWVSENDVAPTNISVDP